MRGRFERGQHGWHYKGSWWQPIIGLIIFLVVISLIFRIVSFILPILLIGALIFFGIKLFNKNGTDKARWEAWGRQFGADAERWGRDFGERAERWGKQFEHKMRGWTHSEGEPDQDELPRKPKRKNDEDVLEIEYEDEPPARREGKGKRTPHDVEYL
ncbi:MAG: hypothetical protein DYG88_04195 [Chloroflexi bacterium CFX4]|nr:hypothetical protein [Chloroflexi bacterium CFX4]MDL1921029.1 hypothetical protein [Chloroflexi bacterium CFX3]